MMFSIKFLQQAMFKTQGFRNQLTNMDGAILDLFPAKGAKYAMIESGLARAESLSRYRYEVSSVTLCVRARCRHY